MFIGEFAKLCGVSSKTIRYYEEYGLLPAPARQGNYRIYQDTYVETVKQIQQAQAFGLNLKDIAKLCEGQDIKRGLPKAVILQAIEMQQRSLIEQQEQIQAQLTQLAQLKSSLNCP